MLPWQTNSIFIRFTDRKLYHITTAHRNSRLVQHSNRQKRSAADDCRALFFLSAAWLTSRRCRRRPSCRPCAAGGEPSRRPVRLGFGVSALCWHNALRLRVRPSPCPLPKARRGIHLRLAAVPVPVARRPCRAHPRRAFVPRHGTRLAHTHIAAHAHCLARKSAALAFPIPSPPPACLLPMRMEGKPHHAPRICPYARLMHRASHDLCTALARCSLISSSTLALILISLTTLSFHSIHHSPTQLSYPRTL